MTVPLIEYSPQDPSSPQDQAAPENQAAPEELTAPEDQAAHENQVEAERPVTSGMVGLESAEQPTDLENLRLILFGSQAEKIGDLQAGLDHLKRQMNDEQALVKMIAPVLGEAIRLKIQEARDEMIEALYPIIGKVVQRAVKEAVSDLARTLDAQAKRTFNLRLIGWRLRARFGGASKAQIHLRELLPFAATDALLIHRESGLLLRHLSSQPKPTSDTDLISGMLTAIRDFAQDTLGENGEGDSADEGSQEAAELGEIAYGDRQILIESNKLTYLAVIVEGTAPPDFRQQMRDCLHQIEAAYRGELRAYQGESSFLKPVEPDLRSLLVGTPAKGLSTTQKRLLAGSLGGLSLLLIVSCIFLSWLWRASHPAAAPIVAVATFTALPPSATIALSPTATATSTSTALATDTAVPPTSTLAPSLTPTEIPPTPAAESPTAFTGVLLGNVWVYQGPSLATERLGLALPQGDEVEILGAYGDWIRIRWVSPSQDAESQTLITGWVPARWIGTLEPIPARLVTPAP